MVISRTPYRISLFGGGTDYPAWYRQHGGVCLGATIDRYCYISVRWLPPFFPHRLRVVWSRIELAQTRADIGHPAVRAALELMDLDAVEIQHAGDLPARSGIGSSSAFSVGLLHALHALRGEMVDPERLADAAIRLERDVLGEPVGCQDQILSALGGLRLVELAPSGLWRADPIPVLPEVLQALNDRLLLFYAGPRTSGTRSAQWSETSMARIQEMPRRAIALLRDGDLAGIGDLLEEAWHAKRAVAGATTPEVDAWWEISRRAGARGAKLLGAGGGGFLVVYAEPDRHSRVIHDLSECVHVPFRLEPDGSRIVYLRAEPRP